jgi:hypothetical protein
LIRKHTTVTSIQLQKSRTLRSKAIPCTCLEKTRAFQETEAPIFHDSQHMKMVSPMHCQLYLQEIFLVIISVRGWVGPGSTVRSEGIYQCEIPVTPLVIEPETFRLLDQCFNRLKHRVSKITEQLCTPFNTSVRRLYKSGWRTSWVTAVRPYKCQENNQINITSFNILSKL